MNTSYPAVPRSVPEARRAIAAFALECGATRQLLDNVRLACSEALTNVVMHAYDSGTGEIHVTAAVAEDELWVLIADDGVGLHPNGSRRGLGMGLALIARAADYFAVVKRAEGGTEIRMRFDMVPGDGGDWDQSRGSDASLTAPL